MGKSVIRTAAHLEEVRDTVRQILGAERFAKRMGDIKPLLQAYGDSPLKAALVLTRANNLDGMEAMVVLAAAVELGERERPGDQHRG